MEAGGTWEIAHLVEATDPDEVEEGHEAYEGLGEGEDALKRPVLCPPCGGRGKRGGEGRRGAVRGCEVSGGGVR